MVDKYFLSELYGLSNYEERNDAAGLFYFTGSPMGIDLGGTSSVADAKGLARGRQVVGANFMQILAGGREARKESFTMTIPKPLLSFGNAPMFKLGLRIKGC